MAVINKQKTKDYVECLNQETINQGKKEFLEELDRFAESLMAALEYTNETRECIKNNTGNIETVGSILAFADTIDELLEDINNSLEVM